MGGSPIEGPRLFPDLRLGPHLPTAQGSSVAVGEEGQTPHSEDQWVDSSPEFQEGTRAPTPETPISPHTPHGKPGRSRSPSSLKRTLFEGMSSFLKPGNNQPWWKSLLASPARRLAANHPQAPPVAQGLGKLELPVSASRVKKRRPSPHAGANAPKARAKAAISKRKDLPKSRSTANNMSKPSLRNAIAVMKSKNTMKAAMKEVENDYFANSSRVARSAKRHAVKSILETAFSTAMPLSPAKLQALAGALRTSGYKSAHTYLVEAKIYHVEKGWKWSHLLDRHFKLCVKAVKRGMGPAKKAPEVAADLWKSQPLLPDSESTSGKVLLAGHLFACGVHWMMREIEIAALTSENVRFEDKNRLVTLVWNESKGDQEGASISRTLQCLCLGACDMACPYAVLEVLVNQACLRGNEGAALSVCSNGDRATKAQLVADWRNLFGSTITGHSTRRSGALQYIRDGWSVSQVAFLGRWKSSVILEYAKEALQSIPLNADKKLFGNSELHQTSQTDEDKHEGRASFQPSNLELVGKLKTEIDSFMNGTKADTTELTTKVRQLETKFENYTKFLPPLVISNRASVVHRNNKVFLCSPSYMWRTQCGWNYYNSDYEFSEDLGMKVTCQKCSTSALQQRGKGADVLADTRTMPSI